MADPTPLQSLDALHRVIEKVPVTGDERDALRWHTANISKALQPAPASGASTPPVPAETNGRSAE